MATFDVKDYGAAGNGISDDTQAIQSAIDAAAAAGGGEVYLGAGTYSVSPTGSGAAGCLVLASDVFLRGSGMGTTVIKLASNAGAVDGVIRGGGTSIGASHLSIDGSRSEANTQVDGWDSGGYNDVTLNAVEVFNARGYGFDLRGQGHSFTLSNSIAHHNSLDGVIADGQVASVITDTAAYANGGNGFNLGGELRLLDSDAYSNGDNGVLLVEGDSSQANTSSIVVDGGTAYDNVSAGVHAIQVDLFRINGVEAYGNGSYGIHSDGSREGDITYNKVHDNNLENPSGEIWIEGLADNPDVVAERLTATRNIVTGGPNSFYGIVESPGSGDGNIITDNIISGTTVPVVISGDNSVERNNVPFILTYGTPAADRLLGSLAQEQIYAGAGGDRIEAGGGNDALIGGAGRDVLFGGAGDDVFRFTALTDSYRTPTASLADRIVDFNADQDRLDLTALGYTALGNGHGDTLRLTYNDAKGLTYLKNFDADSAGRRFELAFDGHLTLSADNLQLLQSGSAAANTLTGTAAAETFEAGSGADQVSAGGNDDRLYGDAGGDTLTGGSGADTFVYRSLADSLRTSASNGAAGRDTLVDFDGASGDQIDVSALGYTGFGNGLGGTLKVTVSGSGDRTIIKSLEEDTNGAHFELLLQGDQKAWLTTSSLIFSHPFDATPSSVPPGQDIGYYGGPGRDVLVGNSGNNLLSGGDGNDRLTGNVGDDVLVGGGGTDFLTGNSGQDIYRYLATTDSFRTGGQVFTDSLMAFDTQADRIDVSALGFTGLGNGHDGTLQLTSNTDQTLTYVRSLDEDTQGRRFEVRLYGDLKEALDEGNFIFAHGDPPAPEPLSLLGITTDQPV